MRVQKFGRLLKASLKLKSQSALIKLRVTVCARNAAGSFTLT